MRRLETQFLVADAKEQAILKDRVEKAAVDAKELRKVYERLISDEEDRKLFQAGSTAFDDYAAVTSKLIALALSGDQGRTDATALLFGDSRSKYTLANKVIDDHVAYIVKAAEETGKRGEATASAAKTGHHCCSFGGGSAGCRPGLVRHRNDCGAGGPR